MKLSYRIVSGVLLGFLLLSFIKFRVSSGSVLSVSNTSRQIQHESNIYDQTFFDQAYSLSSDYRKVPDFTVRGGIVPHHLLAAPLIAAFFDGISSEKYETVVLISPNHFGVGPYFVTTSFGDWNTVFGTLSVNINEVSFLNKTKAAGLYEDLFSREHGIYGITPFIKKTFPEATFVPVVIKGGTTREDCDRIAAALYEISQRSQTLIVVSSDFSHYLPSTEADLFDRESIEALMSFDLEKVLQLDHTKNTDSPESLYVLLKVMELQNMRARKLVATTNSAKLTHQPTLMSTTSYVTLYLGDINQKAK